jgi:hypothetical protein
VPLFDDRVLIGISMILRMDMYSRGQQHIILDDYFSSTVPNIGAQKRSGPYDNIVTDRNPRTDNRISPKPELSALAEMLEFGLTKPPHQRRVMEPP